MSDHSFKCVSTPMVEVLDTTKQNAIQVHRKQSCGKGKTHDHGNRPSCMQHLVVRVTSASERCLPNALDGLNDAEMSRWSNPRPCIGVVIVVANVAVVKGL